MIAATALDRGLALVTRNVTDFEPFGVSLLDPCLRTLEKLRNEKLISEKEYQERRKAIIDAL